MARREIWEFNADHMFWPEISSIAFGTFIFWRFHKHWNRLITDPISFIGAIIKAGANATAVSSLLTRPCAKTVMFARYAWTTPCP
jgi:hypothetical protein